MLRDLTSGAHDADARFSLSLGPGPRNYDIATYVRLLRKTAAGTARWDAYPNERVLMGTVRTSRGCPFECEFCDVIRYLGRKQWHEPIDAVLAELDVLHHHCYRRVTIADDNFTASRGRATELLDALRVWNARQGADRMRFITQIPVDVERNDELLGMCAAAWLTHVFVGIDTPNEASLRERTSGRSCAVISCSRSSASSRTVSPAQRDDRRLLDADDASSFERQYEFAMRAGIPVRSLGALVAPVATPLHARRAAAGRLIRTVPRWRRSRGAPTSSPRG
jgi:hypothetical protein